MRHGPPPQVMEEMANRLALDMNLPCSVEALARCAALVIDASHAVNGREAWALLWRILAHEINALESGAQRPDVGRFDAEQIRAGQAFAHHLAALIAKNPRDYVGEIYMTKRFANARLGQVFTPPCAAEFVAASVGDALLARDGELTTSPAHPWFDPCSGAGAFPLAALRFTRARGLDPVYMIANDIDPLCADMTFVQMAYAGAVGEVHTGDFLRMPKPEESGDAVRVCDLPPLTHMTPWNMTLVAYYQGKQRKRREAGRDD